MAEPIELTPEESRALLRAALADAACVLGGLGLYFATGSWIWIASGVLLGVGIGLPTIIRIWRARR